MFEDKDQSIDDLFDTSSAENSSDAESTSEEPNITEENSSSLDAQSKPSAQVERDKQVNAWTTKILNGEVGLDDLPSKQKWLKPLIESQLGLDKKVQDLDQVAEQIVVRKLKEREEASIFEKLKDEVNSKKLTGAQKAELNTQYKDLLAAGLPKAKALQTALKLAQIDESEPNLQQRKAMQQPYTGDYSGVAEGADRDVESLMKQPKEKRMEYYKSVMAGRE